MSLLKFFCFLNITVSLLTLTSIDLTAGESDKPIQKYRFSGYPQAAYSKETGFIGGGILFLKYRPEITADIIDDIENNFSFTARYSEKHQFYAKFEPDIYIYNGDYFLSLPLEYQNWPSTFYGIGNDSSEKDGEDYTPEIFKTSVTLKRKLLDKWSIALLYELEYFKILKMKSDLLLATKTIPGSEENLVSGSGISLIFDTRDSETYPEKGNFFTINFLNFNPFLGSDYNFSRIDLDLRHFLSPGNNQVLAIQSGLTMIKGDAPFNKLSKVDSFLRAYNVDQFIDLHVGALRMEYRIFPSDWKILKRIGFVFFTETGQVANSLAEFAFSELKLSYGLGIRYAIFTDEIFNLRLDVGFGKNSSNISVSGGEAF